MDAFINKYTVITDMWWPVRLVWMHRTLLGSRYNTKNR